MFSILTYKCDLNMKLIGTLFLQTLPHLLLLHHHVCLRLFSIMAMAAEKHQEGGLGVMYAVEVRPQIEFKPILR